MAAAATCHAMTNVNSANNGAAITTLLCHLGSFFGLGRLGPHDGGLLDEKSPLCGSPRLFF